MLIQPYTKQWIANFQAIKGILQEALQDLSISIEHIGSTAVPDLDAKPVIDIDIIRRETLEFEEIRTRLEAIGYYHNGNQGIPEREVFKRLKMATPHVLLDSIPHHLYVCVLDSPALQRHLLFRDYLRTHAEARLAYQRLKYEIAEEVQQNQKQYAELKEMRTKEFIDGIVLG